MSKILYIVRHGESMGNVKRRLLSPEEDILTDIGKQQAMRLGQHLSNVKLSRVYSSDYPRAAETAATILAQSKVSRDVELCLDSRLRERHYGDFEGLSYKEGFKRYNEQAQNELSLLSILSFEFANAETVRETVERFYNFFTQLFAELDKAAAEEDENVLVVSHSFAMVCFMHHLGTMSATANHDEDNPAGAAGAVPVFRLSNWNSAEDLKIMRNVSYMKIQVERKEPQQEKKGRLLTFLAKHETSHLDGLPTHGTFSQFAQQTSEAKQFGGCVQQ